MKTTFYIPYNNHEQSLNGQTRKLKAYDIEGLLYTFNPFKFCSFFFAVPGNFFLYSSPKANANGRKPFISIYLEYPVQPYR